MIQLKDLKPAPIFTGNAPPASDIWATDCSFKKGITYLITAPSGKGKSTLLHLIYGLRKDYSGTILIGDESAENIALDTWAELRQRKFSIVFQDLRLFLDLTALQNIQLNSQLQPHLKEDRILEMARLLGVADLMHKPCHTLSYGQRQRIAIIRALSQPFDFLLLDEPFSHLDTANVTIARQLIQEELERQNAGLLLVSLGEDYGFDYQERLTL